MLIISQDGTMTMNEFDLYIEDAYICPPATDKRTYSYSFIYKMIGNENRAVAKFFSKEKAITAIDRIRTAAENGKRTFCIPKEDEI